MLQSTRLIQLMGSIEDLQGDETFEDLYPELTKEIWDSIDKKDKRQVNKLIERLNKLYDSLTSD